MNLTEIKIGQEAVIKELNCTDKIRQRFIDLGFFKDTIVIVKSYAPLGDPMVIEINDYEIAIRKKDASKIIVV